MKKILFKICNDFSFEIVQYKSHRSDMGVQYYDILVKYGNHQKMFTDGYFVGENNVKAKLICSFTSFCNQLKSAQ